MNRCNGYYGLSIIIIAIAYQMLLIKPTAYQLVLLLYILATAHQSLLQLELTNCYHYYYTYLLGISSSVVREERTGTTPM